MCSFYCTLNVSMPNLCGHSCRTVWQGQHDTILYFLILLLKKKWFEWKKWVWKFSVMEFLLGKNYRILFFCLVIWYLLTNLFRTMCSREWKCAIYSYFWYLLFHLWWSRGLNLSLVWIEDLQFSDIISNYSIPKCLNGMFRVLFYSNL